jgi:hypothetical protein
MQISNGTAKAVAEAASKVNPANPVEKRARDSARVPMDVPQLKLEVPAIPGYYLYWHLGKNTAKALRAGYTFVDPEEVELNQVGIANSVETPGGTDLGTRISVSAGATGVEGEERLYLMKLPLEHHEEDMEKKTAVNEGIAAQMRAGALGGGDIDAHRRVMKEGQHLFVPKVRR